MKILYAIQATGNGHISRAQYVIPHLEKYGHVDTLVSGSNATLQPNFAVTYKSCGMSLFYKKCGSIDKTALFYKNNYAKAIKDAIDLPVKNYDLIINDFDFVTALACKIRGKRSVQFGHQASFMSDHAPRPAQKSIAGEFVLANYARATQYVGLHFQKYDDFIFPAVIKPEIINATPKDHGHITIYLPSYDDDCFKSEIKKLKHLRFEWFDKGVSRPKVEGNITFFPISNELFTKSMINCHGIITGGGFETPAEALYMKKRILAVPINGQYEQQCNAAALEKMGVPTILNIDNKTIGKQINQWLDMAWNIPTIESNKLEDTIDYIVNAQI
ncbi:MAG TPA: glycosyltransferase family protein [Saprospiraceae bacterium]|nr:glycosyltransferase family protein [Saprospiraceae bacterium]